jgi:hypothetical protein
MEAYSEPMILHQTIYQQSTDNIDAHHYLKFMNVTTFEDFFPAICQLHSVTARCSYDYPAHLY